MANMSNRGCEGMDDHRAIDLAETANRPAHNSGRAGAWSEHESADAGRRGGKASHRREIDRQEPGSEKQAASHPKSARRRRRAAPEQGSSQERQRSRGESEENSPRYESLQREDTERDGLVAQNGPSPESEEHPFEYGERRGTEGESRRADG